MAIHASFLPDVFRLYINLCSNLLNKTVVQYRLEPLSFVASQALSEPAICKEQLTGSKLSHKFPPCGSHNQAFHFICENSRIEPSDVELTCSTNVLNPAATIFDVNCTTGSHLWWSFYPTTLPYFDNYGQLMAFMILATLVCLLTVVFNLAVLIPVFVSPTLKKFNTVVYATHMSIIDLLLALTCQTLYIANHLFVNEYLMQNNLLFSHETHASIQEWLEKLDFILIIAQFVNLALLSAERCAAIMNPFWHLQVVTFRRCIYSLVVVWLYTGVVYALNFHAYNRKLSVSLVLGYGIPTAIIVTTYAIIIYKIRQVDKNKKANTTYNVTAQQSQQMRVTLQLLKLLFVFFICWLPYFILYLIKDESTLIPHSLRVALLWTKLLSYSHSIFDPLFYAMSHTQIKNECLRIVCCRNNSVHNTTTRMRTTHRSRTKTHMDTLGNTSPVSITSHCTVLSPTLRPASVRHDSPLVGYRNPAAKKANGRNTSENTVICNVNISDADSSENSSSPDNKDLHQRGEVLVIDCKQFASTDYLGTNLVTQHTRL